MRTMILAACAAATALSAAPAVAQHYDRDRYDHDGRHRGDRHHDDRRHGRDHRDWHSYRHYDYNHFAPGQQRYYANNYYRDGRYYSTRRLGRRDRIYRGSDNRYYCRRSDGTTGLIVGGIGGALLGNALDGGRSQLLGTLIGGAGGALLGQSVDRGRVTCR